MASDWYQPEYEIRVLGVDNLTIDVGDLALARDFYSRVLNLQVHFEFPEEGLIGFRIGYEQPGMIVREARVRTAGPRPSPVLWLEVVDARAAATALVSAGVNPLGPPRELQTGWVVEVADPWGNVIGLTDYVKAPHHGRRPVEPGVTQPMEPITQKLPDPTAAPTEELRHRNGPWQPGFAGVPPQRT
jgi:predicted enzyme related to lactoylglutathione lyase